MLIRARSVGPSSADRVAGLLAGSGGGWVPPAVQDDVAELDPSQDEPAAGGDADAAVPQAADDAPRSWTPAARHAGSSLVPAPGRWRLEPGRGGVAALLVVTALAAVLAAGVVLHGRPQEVAVPAVEAAGAPLPGATALPGSSTPPGASVEPAPSGEVVVSVAGKVRRPGLVRLPAGSRVDDAVRAAGGPVDDASTGLLNLARRLVDGEQVLVGIDPPPGTAPAGGPESGSAAGGLVDLNTASASDLDALPGIGPVLAQRIVDWRTENGRFASIDQLREVTGIGEAKYEDLQSKVAV